MSMNTVDVFLARCDALMGGRPPQDILQQAYNLLTNEACWTKGARARDQEGRPVRPDDPNAVAWDMEGAVAIASNDFGIMPPYLMIVLDDVACSMGGLVHNALEANETFTHEGMLNLLSRAVDHVRRQSGATL